MLKASNPAEMRDVLLEMIGGGEPVLIIRGSDCEGRAPALRLAQEGAAVALVALPGDDLEAAAGECRATGSAAGCALRKRKKE